MPLRATFPSNPESQYTLVDVATDATTVHNGPAVLFGYTINVVLSAHALPIKDGTTTVLTLAASSAVNVFQPLPGIRFETSLIVDPDNLATGNITLYWLPI